MKLLLSKRFQSKTVFFKKNRTEQNPATFNRPRTCLTDKQRYPCLWILMNMEYEFGPIAHCYITSKNFLLFHSCMCMGRFVMLTNLRQTNHAWYNCSGKRIQRLLSRMKKKRKYFLNVSFEKKFEQTNDMINTGFSEKNVSFKALRAWKSPHGGTLNTSRGKHPFKLWFTTGLS